MNQAVEFVKRYAVKYKEIVIVAIVLWMVYAVGVTFQLVINERHIKNLEETVANQEASIDSLQDEMIQLDERYSQMRSELDSTMEQEVDLELRLQKLERK